MERKVRDSCGKSASRGDPAGESRGGSPTARGKRVPGVEINVQIVQAIKIDKLDFHRVCLQSESPCFIHGLFPLSGALFKYRKGFLIVPKTCFHTRENDDP